MEHVHRPAVPSFPTVIVNLQLTSVVTHIGCLLIRYGVGVEANVQEETHSHAREDQAASGHPG